MAKNLAHYRRWKQLHSIPQLGYFGLVIECFYVYLDMVHGVFSRLSAPAFTPELGSKSMTQIVRPEAAKAIPRRFAHSIYCCISICIHLMSTVSEYLALSFAWCLLISGTFGRVAVVCFRLSLPLCNLWQTLWNGMNEGVSTSILPIDEGDVLSGSP